MQIDKNIVIRNYNFAIKMGEKVGLCQNSSFTIKDEEETRLMSLKNLFFFFFSNDISLSITIEGN